MRGISTFTPLLKGALFTAFLTTGSFTVFGQTQGLTCEPITGTTCTPVDITFDIPNGGGSAFGFTGTDFFLEGANSPNANSDFYMKSTPYSAGTVKTLISETYAPTPNLGSFEYTFELSGTATVATYTTYFVSPSAGRVALCTGTPVYANNGPATICGKIGFNFSPYTGEPFHLEFEFVLTTENNADAHYIKFDNYGTNLIGAEQAPLPVTFTGFHGKKVSRGTQLTWNVADEINVSRYEVQKGSTAGSFKTIGIVFAGEQNTYSFTDEQPTQGTSFYRIKSVDVDGKFKLSTIISLSNGQSVAILRAFPMPARNQVTLQHDAIQGKAQISISSEDGRMVKKVIPSAGSMQTSIDLSTLKAGLYMLRLETSDGQVQTLKLVKQ